jgi:hypothetical protein
VRDLSRKIFGKDYIDDPARWKSVNADAVNAAATALLRDNTAALDKLGDVERYIR